jgi:hypothetical protein
MSSGQDRRAFIATVASISGLAAVTNAAGQASAPPRAQAAPAAAWDLAWFDAFTGRHKQVFDYGTWDLPADNRPFRFVRNYLDSMRDALHMEPPTVNTTVGISRSVLPANMSDAMWERYKLGERFRINDPTTRQPAVRNIFLDAPNEGVKALQASGTIFWQCNVALMGLVGELSRAFNKPAADVRADLIAGLNPGVKLVPSHMFALGMVQERGFTYMKA